MRSCFCLVSEELPNLHRVKGYPTVKAIVNGKPGGEYGGERTAGAIKDWALGLVPNHITTLNRQLQVRSGCSFVHFVYDQSCCMLHLVAVGAEWRIPERRSSTAHHRDELHGSHGHVP